MQRLVQQQVPSDQSGDESQDTAQQLSPSALAASVGNVVSALSGVAGQRAQAAVQHKPRSVVQREDQQRMNACATLMRSMLDTIERQEKQACKRKNKQETSDEKYKRLALHKLHGFVFKHKEYLKRDIMKKRSLLERSITAEIQAEITRTIEERKRRKSAQARKQREAATSVLIAPPRVATPPPVAPPPTPVSSSVTPTRKSTSRSRTKEAMAEESVAAPL